MTLDLSALTAAPSPETAAFVADLKARLRGLPAQNAVPIAATRQARAEGRGLFPIGGPRETSAWIEAPTVPGRVRVSRPAGAVTGIYLHIHGGGWTFGAPEQYDDWNMALAQAAGVAVVSVPYRLAPEHVWPACAEDVAAAALWLLEAGPVLFGTSQMVIGGESAGAHLALVTLLRLRSDAARPPVAGAVLNYGCFDLRLSPSMARWGAEGLVLSTPVVDWFVDNLTGGDRARRADPALSPLLADLSGLPPTLVQVGTFDPLIDDSLGLAAGLVRAGVAVDLRLYPGGVHGFDRFHTAMAAEANAAAAAFVRGCL